MASVAVVIPAYNPGPYLREALASVISQTYSDWEAVVVDDGSDENLVFAAQLDPRIKLLKQANAGVSAARNAGIAATSAPLIAFLDQDDLWLPDKLAKQTAVMSEQRDAGFCSTDFEIVDALGQRLHGRFAGGHASYFDLLVTCAICASTVMVRRTVLAQVGTFNVRYEQTPDWDLWLRIAKSTALARADEVLVRYRMHDSNFSRDHIDLLLGEGTEILRGHELAAAQARDAARLGLRRLRRLVGAQTYDVFRETKRPVHLWTALRLSPRLTLSQLARYARRLIR